MITEELVGRLVRGLRDSDFSGWSESPAGRFLDIPGVGFARVTDGVRLIGIRDPTGYSVTFRVRDVIWTYGATVITEVPGLSIKVSPTPAREGR